MKLNLVLGILIVAGCFAASSNVASAAEVPSKTSEPPDASPNRAVPSAPKPKGVEAKSKRAEPLKWDQLDPKSLEKAAKARPKSPFNAVPAER